MGVVTNQNLMELYHCLDGNWEDARVGDHSSFAVSDHSLLITQPYFFLHFPIIRSWNPGHCIFQTHCQQSSYFNSVSERH